MNSLLMSRIQITDRRYMWAMDPYAERSILVQTQPHCCACSYIDRRHISHTYLPMSRDITSKRSQSFLVTEVGCHEPLSWIRWPRSRDTISRTSARAMCASATSRCASFCAAMPDRPPPPSFDSPRHWDARDPRNHIGRRCDPGERDPARRYQNQSHHQKRRLP